MTLYKAKKNNLNDIHEHGKVLLKIFQVYGNESERITIQVQFHKEQILPMMWKLPDMPVIVWYW